jgi:hypothetical protein
MSKLRSYEMDSRNSAIPTPLTGDARSCSLTRATHGFERHFRDGCASCALVAEGCEKLRNQPQTRATPGSDLVSKVSGEVSNANPR